MNKITKISAIALTTTVLGLASLAAVADRGESGEGCEYGERHNAQMMRHGSGYNMGSHMGYGRGYEKGDKIDRQLDLSAEEVKTLIEAKLIMRGNDRLKVGQVTQKDDQTYVVDIVTVDDSLVRQIEVDKNEGFGRGMHRFGR